MTKIVNDFMAYVKNIDNVYALCTEEEQQHGMTWYADAKSSAYEICDKYELPLHVVVGVIAALSPTNKWETNLRNADDMCRIFTDGGYVEECKPSTYNTMRDKAWSILQSMPHTSGDVAFILRGPKITDFFWCILGDDTCVIDGHAWCIANYDRRKLQDVPNIGKALRQDLQEAYRSVGLKHNMKAYEMQAATWLAWKRIHNVQEGYTMIFKCEIDTENDAFVHDPHYELSKIIKKIARDIDDFVFIERTKIIRDINGNKIGSWQFKV